ncbi:hypothetical protein EON80_17045 [bacterium]|nr:MAG: hypothetical protein EON80_17045 [bacterium]
MKINNIKLAIMAAIAVAPLSGGVASAAPVAPAAAPTTSVKVSLPVVAGAQSLSKSEKAGVAGEGLITLNVLNGASLLNGTSLLNNLNILNIGSFNSFKWGQSGGCGCGSPS